MQIPEFLKEAIWSFYPPRYHELSKQKLSKSLRYMGKVLLIAFLIAGLLYIPKLFLMKSTIREELDKFQVFQVAGNVVQSSPISVPRHKPFVYMDLNAQHNLTQEIFVIDNSTVKYRWFGIKSVPLEQLKEISAHKAEVSGFLTAIIILMLPAIAILLYIRSWLKYFLLVLVLGTFFFIIFELTRFKLKWKEMLNVAAHASTLVILIEVISAPISTAYLLPVMRFLGVNIYAVTTLLFAVLTVVGIVGAQVVEKLKKK